MIPPSGRSKSFALPGWAAVATAGRAVLASGLAGAAAWHCLMLVGGGAGRGLPNLPEISGLTDYQPKMPPSRVFLGRRVLLANSARNGATFTPIAQIPGHANTPLAIEDARFYQHGGSTTSCCAPAWPTWRIRSQGASTITMQVARNFYLSTEKTFTRKIYEVLLAWKIESLLSKTRSSRST